MTARLHVLDSSDCVAIDEATRTLLSKAGVNVLSAPAREVLAAHGASVEHKDTRVRFSSGVIDTALRDAPRKVVLGSRDGKHDLQLPDGRPHVTTDGAGVTVVDFESGDRRPSTSRDLADLTRVADALEAVDVQWPMVVAGDVPRDRHSLVEAAVAFEQTTKHVQHEALSREDAETMVRMAATLVGGSDKLARRPILSSVHAPVSPLQLEAGSTEAMMALARAKVPVLPLSMVLMGGSSPVDLASALVIANAEILASLCVAQGAASGAPVFWSICSGPIDMRTGSFAAGSPEAALLNVAGVDMARHYGLPCLTAGFACDAADAGSQAAAEKIGTGLMAMLAGADLISGIGALETDSTFSMEQLVIDAEFVDYARTCLDPFRVDPDTIHLDMLSRLGPGGNYLRERHTLTHFRDALWSPRLFARDGYVEGRAAEERLRKDARQRADDLRRKHVPLPLEDDVRRAMWKVSGCEPVTSRP